ncbi:unnamed protein product, partial [Polarella glacialis]
MATADESIDTLRLAADLGAEEPAKALQPETTERRIAWSLESSEHVPASSSSAAPEVLEEDHYSWNQIDRAGGRNRTFFRHPLHLPPSLADSLSDRRRFVCATHVMAPLFREGEGRCSADWRFCSTVSWNALASGCMQRCSPERSSYCLQRSAKRKHRSVRTMSCRMLLMTLGGTRRHIS